MMLNGQHIWHYRHDRLLDLIYGTEDDRAEEIKQTKPPGEIPLRLRLMRPVKGDLPIAVLQASQSVTQAKEVLNECADALNTRMRSFVQAATGSLVGNGTCFPELEAYKRAWLTAYQLMDAHEQTVVQHSAEIASLHNTECPNCPWDGRTIFSEVGTA